MKRAVVWKRVDTVGAEYAEIDWEPLRIDGDVVLVEDGGRCAASYRVECDAAGATLRASVHAKLGGARRECHVERSSAGRWTVNGALVPELDGFVDVDVAITPSTNTLPIRRLRLAVGQRVELTAAWIRFPALDVAPLRQAYRRVDTHVYEYESPEHGFVARLECDDDGIVRTYGGLWSAVARQP